MDILTQLESTKFSLIGLWLECSSLGVELNEITKFRINNVVVHLYHLTENKIDGCVTITINSKNQFVYFRKTSTSNWMWCCA